MYGLQLWKGVSIMNKKIKTDAVDSLFDAVLCLQSREECYSFFEDLCTVNELLSLSQRFEVAAMLKDGKTYLEIAEKTGASTATISRVNRSLNYGNDGYELVFGRMEKKRRWQIIPNVFFLYLILLFTSATVFCVCSGAAVFS